MAEPTVVTVDPPPPAGGSESGLSVPPFDSTYFSEQLLAVDGSQNDAFSLNNFDLDSDLDLDMDLDLDFSIDDMYIPSFDLDELLNPIGDSKPVVESNSPQFATNYDQFPHDAVFEGEGGFFPADHSSNRSGVSSSESPAMESHQVSGYRNVSSPESNGWNPESSEKCVGDAKGLTCHSPESQGSGNCSRSSVLEDSNNASARSVSSSPDFNNSSRRVEVGEQKFKLQDSVNVKNVNRSSLLKRKKDSEDLVMNNNVESRINKQKKGNCNVENNSNDHDDVGLGEVDKRKARLLRNRESAQLSRQRKKQYVEELEDKVKAMHSTIQDLNMKISYFMAENATLRQQAGGPGGGGIPAPPMVPPPPGMYPHPPMMYPWMPYAPPYMVKPQGSQVPLVPIPRLKSQQPAHAPKVSKKVDNKKKEGQKIKKVAGVSFLGLLFFMMLFGVLVPMVNVRYGGVREALTGGESYVKNGFYERHPGRVLMVNGTEYGEKHGVRKEFSGASSIHCGHGVGVEPRGDEFVRCNGSEPLVASLYVPRNDKLVKIDGSLIIHSVLASDKSMASHGEKSEETGLVVAGDLYPAIPVASSRTKGAGHPLRALGSGAGDNDNSKSSAIGGKIQEWFREGFSGPMLTSGMCTEVFQFDVSSAIVPADTKRNITEERNQNSTRLSRQRNRRILNDLPIPHPEFAHNISRERGSQKETYNGNNNSSSMVVSVLVDPREAGDADIDGVIRTKSLSRIFVVVLVDSVKYVTYSCMLPFKGSAAPHLVTT